MDLNSRLEGRDCSHQRDHVSRAAHIVLHLFHPWGGLDADATRVEGESLSNKDDLLLRAARGLIRHVHESRIAFTPLPHGDDELHSFPFHRRAIQNGDMKPARLAYLDG